MLVADGVLGMILVRNEALIMWGKEIV